METARQKKIREEERACYDAAPLIWLGIDIASSEGPGSKARPKSRGGGGSLFRDLRESDVEA